jgi:hypothetical protein
LYVTRIGSEDKGGVVTTEQFRHNFWFLGSHEKFITISAIAIDDEKLLTVVII